MNSLYVARNPRVAARSLDGEVMIMSGRDSTLFTLANWGDVVPNVGEVDAARIHLVLVAAVVVFLASAVAARFYGEPVWMEDGGFWAFDEIQERVMGRIEAALDRKPVGHVDGHPVAEGKAAGQEIAKSEVPLGKVVEEE